MYLILIDKLITLRNTLNTDAHPCKGTPLEHRALPTSAQLDRGTVGLPWIGDGGMLEEWAARCEQSPTSVPPRDTHSKYVTVLLLHPGQEASGISPKLQGMAQPGDAAQVQRRLARSPAEATALSIT